MLRLIIYVACALPFLEIAGFVWLGGKLGVGLTILWVIGAMVAGLALLRRTGLQAVGRLRAALAEGREPGHSIIDAACFAGAAMLLIIPGFVSDALALVLMLPATRHWLLRRTAAHFEARVYRGTGMIQGEFTVVSENDEDVTKDDDKSQPRIKDERNVIDVE
ncbi:MAG TPA: FxsA family protein [Dongiaceae bacterium]